MWVGKLVSWYHSDLVESLDVSEEFRNSMQALLKAPIYRLLAESRRKVSLNRIVDAEI